MSVFAKVLAVFLLLLSLIYCGVTVVLYTHRTDWRQEAVTVQKALDKLQAESSEQIKKLDADLTDATTKATDLKTQYDALKKEYDESEGDRADKAQRIAEQERIIREKDDVIKGKDDKITGKDDEIKMLNEKGDKLLAQLQESKEIQRTSEEKLLIAEDENDTLRRKVEGLHNQLVESKRAQEAAESVIAQLEENGIPVKEIVVSDNAGPTTPIKGTVLAVRNDANIVMLSVGGDNDVKQGFRFTVYRDDKFVGKVEVEKVFADMCSARILKEFTHQEVKEGDRASTRVY